MKDLKKSFSHFFKRFWPIGLLLIVVFAFFWKFFLANQVPFPGDFVVGIYFPWLDYKWGYAVGVPVKNPIMADVPSFMYPMQTLASDMIKSGQLALWNPYILAGNPLLANFQSAPYSIVNIFYFLTDKVNAWGIQIIFQHIAAAIFSYILLRYWKVSKLGSALGGIIYAFSGFNLIWSQWNGHALSAAFIPLLLYLEDRFLTENKLKFGAFISVVLGLQIYSGYPQVVLYTALAMGILFVFRIFPEFKSIKRVLLKTLTLALFCLVGIGLSAPQWLPGAELLATSQRAVEFHPFEWAFLPWSKVITFIASDFYGNHATNNYWGAQDYTSNIGFVGVVGFMMTVLSIRFLKLKKEVFICLVILIVSLLLAFPTPLSVYLWKSGILGLNAASAHRSLILWNLSVALLAAFGFDSLDSKKSLKLRDKIFPIAIVFLMILGFGFYAYIVRSKTTYGASVFPIAMRNLVIPTAVFLASSAIIVLKERLRFILVGLVIIELFYFGWKFTPFFDKNMIFPKTPILEYLIAQEKPFRVTGNKVIPMNMRMSYGLESPEGYDAVYPESISKLISTMNDVSSETSFTGRYGTIDREESHILDLMNTKYFLALKLDDRGNPSVDGENILETYKNPKFKKVFEDKSVMILENKNVFPRAFIVYDWEVVADEKETLNKMLDSEYPLRKKIIISKEVPDLNPRDRYYEDSIVKYLKYKEESSMLEVETKSSGLLFVSDTFYPGWKAYVDDQETEIYLADFAFRAIMVPSGKHKVEFKYAPESFYNGLKVAAVSTLVIILTIGYTLLEKKRNEKY